jgi:hypothetical protein
MTLLIMQHYVIMMNIVFLNVDLTNCLYNFLQIQARLTPNGPRVLLRSPVQENCYKVQLRRVFWNRYTNETYIS